MEIEMSEYHDGSGERCTEAGAEGAGSERQT